MRYGARVTQRDTKKQTALHVAAECDDVAAVELLLSRCASVMAVDESEDTALHLAIRKKREDAVAVLLPHWDMTKVAATQALLRFAAQQGSFAVVEYILQSSFTRMPHWNPAALSTAEPTLLHHAAAGGNERIVQLLLEQGFVIDAVDAEGATPLHYALRVGKMRAPKVLIKYGASLQHKDHAGRDALRIINECDASLQEIMELAELLFKHGAEVDAADQWANFWSPQYSAMVLVVAASQGKADAVQQLMTLDLDPSDAIRLEEEGTYYADYLLFSALIGGLLDVAEYLWNAGARFGGDRDEVKLDAFRGLIVDGASESLQWLLEKDESWVTKLQGDRHECVSLAVRSGEPATVELVLKRAGLLVGDLTKFYAWPAEDEYNTALWDHAVSNAGAKMYTWLKTRGVPLRESQIFLQLFTDTTDKPKELEFATFMLESELRDQLVGVESDGKALSAAAKLDYRIEKLRLLLKYWPREDVAHINAAACVALHHGALQCLQLLVEEHGAKLSLVEERCRKALLEQVEELNYKIVAYVLRHAELGEADAEWRREVITVLPVQPNWRWRFSLAARQRATLSMLRLFADSGAIMPCLPKDAHDRHKIEVAVLFDSQEVVLLLLEVLKTTLNVTQALVVIETVVTRLRRDLSRDAESAVARCSFWHVNKVYAQLQAKALAGIGSGAGAGAGAGSEPAAAP